MQVSQELADAFLEAQDGSKRYLIVRINAESLTLTGSQVATESASDDFQTIQDNVVEHEPSFILFRRETKSAEERPWTLIS